jgi:PhzF family phenazine biosynthesis protein
MRAKLCVGRQLERGLRIFQVDAFTRTRFSGNPATVILDADGHDDATLQSVAREFPHAETAFVFAASGPAHDVRLRFFNARKESPFVGHATIAAHAVLLALGRRGFGVCRQSSGTGIIEVTAAPDAAGDAERPLIEFRQAVPELDNPLPLKTTLRVAEALHLPGAQLHETLPARLARGGSTRLLVPIGNARGLDGIAPNFETLAALGSELGAEGFFVFAHRRAPDDGSTDSRMFCPALGILEDPVSGNAHAMLATYLWELGQLGRQAAFIGRQGRQMNRPGEVSVSPEIERGELLAVRIGGRAVIVSEGTLAA